MNVILSIVLMFLIFGVITVALVGIVLRRGDKDEHFAAKLVEAEREACARVAETHALNELASTDDWPDEIAAAIRARGETK